VRARPQVALRFPEVLGFQKEAIQNTFVVTPVKSGRLRIFRKSGRHEMLQQQKQQKQQQ
jgi:hypothetical protein